MEVLYIYFVPTCFCFNYFSWRLFYMSPYKFVSFFLTVKYYFNNRKCYNCYYYFFLPVSVDRQFEVYPNLVINCGKKKLQ